MSKINFLKQEYRIEQSRKDKRCGIIDGQDELPAYTTIDANLKWNAVIDNANSKEFVFVPIDHSIRVYKKDGNLDSTCDGMVLVQNLSLLAFVELKDVRSGGMADAIGQLKHTIELFGQNHQYDIFRIRRAYAANIAHPQFHYNMKDEIESFRALHFVLYPEATIKF